MRRNEKNTAVAAEDKSVILTEAQKREFVKTMKIAYYKEFYKQGLITADQLEKLIAMQDKPDKKQAA